MHHELPPPLMTSDPGSFARRTIVERKPRIIQQVIEDNDYPAGVLAALEGLRDEIARHPIQPLTEIASDVESWNGELATHYSGRTWLQVPWFFAETFFYRRLLEVVGYFRPGPWQGQDPFALQKRRQERLATDWFAESWLELAATEPLETFETLLHSCLWGNRADLSNFTIHEQASGGMAARQQHHILINHTEQAAALLSPGVQRVDFVNDNSGSELLFDLALASFLLTQEWAHMVVFHLKNQPFFVSDAMPRDVEASLAQLQGTALGSQLGGHLAAGRLILQDHPFWTTYLMFRQMPAIVSTELAPSDLVILKGDVNYRRLLDDRHWPHTTPMEGIVAYFPAPFLALRTLKGEIMVGLEPGQAEQLAAQDPTWLINGKRGIIQLVRPTGA